MPLSFFLEFPEFPRFTKKDVDACNIEPIAAALCDAIRAVFFLSRSIRKERTLWLSFASDRALVQLEGATLRYLGPDERSTLMLVDKAASMLHATPSSWTESTPGVSCRAGISPREALAIVATEHPETTIIAPRFTGNVKSAGSPPIEFSPTLPELMASGHLVAAIAFDGTLAHEWPGTLDPPSSLEQLINVEVKVSTGSLALAPRILALNLIEDCTRKG